ncbi:MAG: type III-B CRISPR module RAMP protein Cmr4 [Gammaproteobacteria bacterium]|nr:type III-B CRISPR module RAMP protein Cmr4 [Gammaproteobacteria bacterium]
MTNANNTPSAILGLRAQSSIHAGAGQRTGIIDLPIQREGHNGWPCIFGSSVKGALRTHAVQQNSNDISVVFGPESGGGGSDHAGAIMVSDARLMLYPVRSLTSQFKWVTCPEAIRRYLSDSSRLHFDHASTGLKALINNLVLSDEEAFVHSASTIKDLFLEEYRFTTSNKSDLNPLIEMILPLMSSSDSDTTDTRGSLERQLVIVSDDMFAYLVGHTTPVNPHISIDSESKTVRPGALWYEETLPPETLLYVGVGANHSRKKNGADRLDSDQASAILTTFLDLFADHPWLQIGGNETLGMGWCAMNVVERED